jgi:SNF2 family DNA or RNA helicase
LQELLEGLAAEEERKIVLFSEWTTMLTLIERQIKRLGLDYVRLDGSVPQKKRQQLVHRFQRDPACRVFLTTNAGSTGLNLQAANTVINVDLPWNPAVRAAYCPGTSDGTEESGTGLLAGDRRDDRGEAAGDALGQT